MTANQPTSYPQEHKWLYRFIALAVAVNFSGLFVTIMEPDAGIYATVSKNMVLRNNYLELIFQNKDWLDKPHFPFWITAFFFKIFGINTLAYKLPGILFVMMGAWYTYRFALLHYNKTIALWAAFILLTTEHILISNNDVRAEPYLTGFIIAAIYYFSKSISKKIGWNLFAACFFTGCAVMTKGPFSLFVIGTAVAGHLIINRNWKEIFHWKWLIAGVLTALFIAPELYSLWYQFDNHPEKLVHGKNGVSGINFFLWDGQFSRFADTGMLKEKRDHIFYLHTLLWAFLPWSLIMFTAVIQKIKNGRKKNELPQQEWFTLGGSLLTILLFSLTRFQLPYYTNIIFPLLAIITAAYINKIRETTSGVFRIIQNVLTIIILVAVVLLQVFYTPSVWSIFSIIILGILFWVLVLLPGRLQWNKTLTAFCRAAIATLLLNFYLNQFFYPDLLKYQSSTESAFYINKNYPGKTGVYVGLYSPAYEFYVNGTALHGEINPLTTSSPQISGLWYLTEEEFQQLKTSGTKYEVVKEFSHFNVTQLNLKFINKKTRSKELKRRYLVRML